MPELYVGCFSVEALLGVEGDLLSKLALVCFLWDVFSNETSLISSSAFSSWAIRSLSLFSRLMRSFSFSAASSLAAAILASFSASCFTLSFLSSSACLSRLILSLSSSLIAAILASSSASFLALSFSSSFSFWVSWFLSFKYIFFDFNIPIL